jgi:hypothetical protein
MEGLRDKPELRARIAVSTTGVKEGVALKKSWQSTAEDVQIAIEEGETVAGDVVALFDSDDRVRYLDRSALWSFLTEGAFWKVAPGSGKEYATAQKHIAYLLDTALSEKLLSHQELVEGLTVAEISARLPKAELGKIIEQALTCGKSGTLFTDVDLLTALPPAELVKHLPLRNIWEQVVVPKIAERHEYAAPRQSEVPSSSQAPAAKDGGSETEAEAEPVLDEIDQVVEQAFGDASAVSQERPKVEVPVDEVPLEDDDVTVARELPSQVRAVVEQAIAKKRAARESGRPRPRPAAGIGPDKAAAGGKR